MEGNGIRIDVPLLKKTKEDLKDKVRSAKDDIEKASEWRTWKKRYGHKTNIAARQQLAHVLFNELGLPRIKLTDKGNDSTDDEALQQLNHPFTNKLADYFRLEKALNTFIVGIEREIVGDRIHPVFNLHIARSFRSSSDSPNFQNFPVRNKDIAKIIRSLFIPSPYSCFSENDFKGIEVGVSACYHQDEVFIDYITTPGKDMHRDMAAQVYMLDPSDVSKDARYGAKNKFVFPQFYGDWYLTCAKNLWDWAIKGKLTTPDGKPLVSLDRKGKVTGHLRDMGIRGLGACDPDLDPVKGTFEYHLKMVEKDFWERRFKGYGQWRKDAYKEYLRNGYFDLHTGFRVHGICNRKVVTNYPIQGSAFHCLLWTLIRVNRALRKYKMKSMLVGQIHDSLIGDVRTRELNDYLSIVEEVVTVKLRKYYSDWLTIPLELEYEVTPSFEDGGNWYKKREVKFSRGSFRHPEKENKLITDPIQFINILNSLSKN